MTCNLKGQQDTSGRDTSPRSGDKSCLYLTSLKDIFPKSDFVCIYTYLPPVMLKLWEKQNDVFAFVESIMTMEMPLSLQAARKGSIVMTTKTHSLLQRTKPQPPFWSPWFPASWFTSLIPITYDCVPEVSNTLLFYILIYGPCVHHQLHCRQRGRFLSHMVVCLLSGSFSTCFFAPKR